MTLISLLILAASMPAILATDTSALEVSRDRPQDGLILSLADATKEYRLRQLEAASLYPFCLSVVYTVPDAPAKSIYHQCFAPGFYVITDFPGVRLKGGSWHSLDAIMEPVVPHGAAKAQVKLLAEEIIDQEKGKSK